MKGLLSVLCLLYACGPAAPPAPVPPPVAAPPNPSRNLPQTPTLPFWLSSAGNTSPDPDAPPSFIGGVGDVTPQEVADALKAQGIFVSADHISVLGAPALPPPLAPGSPVRARLVAAETARGGEAYSAEVHLTNLTFRTLEGRYGSGVLDAVIEDSAGKAVYWATPRLVGMILHLTTCPTLADCDRTLVLNFRLDRFQPALPLQPGNYTLHVFVTRLVLHGRDTFTLSFRLPPHRLTILP